MLILVIKDKVIMVSNSNIFIFSFGVDNSVSLHTDDRKKDIMITGEVPTHGLDGTAITVLRENIRLSLHNFWLIALGMLIVYKSINSKQRPLNIISIL